MVFKWVKRTVHELRQQPEPVRLRAASYVTAIGGLVLGGLWLTVLLPLQLKLTRDAAPFPEETLFREMAENPLSIDLNGLPAGQVGGAQDPASGFPAIVSPAPRYSLPVATTLPTPTPSPTPSPSAAVLPVETTPSPGPTLPNEVDS